MNGAEITLNKAEINRKYRVTRIGADKMMRARLRQLGIVDGTVIVPLVRSRCGDISAYYARGSKAAFRRECSQQIYVEPIWDATEKCNREETACD